MNSNTLVLEDNNEEIIEISNEEAGKVKYCLNCGTNINDNFCPHCGQPTATPSKLKMKNFGKGVLMSFGRLTPGFFNTAKGLMFHPWTVIRDHLHGRHKPYSPPITMLIQIALYSTLIFAIMDSIFGTHTNLDESLFGYKGDNPIIKMIDTSVVISTLIAAMPICFGIYLAYYRHGAKKYNFAEYLAAFTYLFGSITLWDTFLTFSEFIPGIDFDMTSLTLVIVGIFSVIILWKAFPQKSWLKSVALLFWCGFVLFFCLIIIGLLMTLPRLIERWDIIKDAV